MKTNILILLCLCLLNLSCNNDDDNAPDQEITQTDLINATASLASYSTLVTIDLESGNTIATQNDQLLSNLTYEDSFIGLFPDRLVRSTTTDLAGEQIWEVSPGIETGLDLSFTSSRLVIQGNIIYLTFRAIDSGIPATFYTMMAINAVSGDTIWTISQLDNEFKHIAILNDNLITVEGPQGFEIMTSRNLSDGSILTSWNLEERVSNLITGTNEVIVMSWSSAVYSIQEDLTLNWTFSTSGANVQRGAIVGNQFLFHSRDKNIYAVNLQTADLNWSQAFPDLFIRHFFNDGTSIWSVTQDFNTNTFNINELDTSTGTISSNFNIPLPIAPDDVGEVEVLSFSDYLLILTGRSGGSTITDFYKYKTQEMIWQSEVDLNDIFTIKANILLGNNRYAPTSF
ncbi:MAG: outer membrane protein assembly factor BamB [Dokdonia sp.]|jgi:outer membrane protein assembly factor BamB